MIQSAPSAALTFAGSASFSPMPCATARPKSVSQPFAPIPSEPEAGPRPPSAVPRTGAIASGL